LAARQSLDLEGEHHRRFHRPGGRPNVGLAVALILVIGNKNYSSWSLRPWFLMKHFGIEFDEVKLSLDTPSFAEQIGQWSPSGRVPVLLDDGVAVWDSLAIAEYVNETRLDGRGWPDSPARRAAARSVVAEMHAGFAAMRSELPMNVRRPQGTVTMSAAAMRDIERILDIWSDCLTTSSGPFLFGAYSIADAFYAPVALRFQTYRVAMSSLVSGYHATMLAHPALREWCADAAAETEVVAADER